jgi:hypothetical protein
MKLVRSIAVLFLLLAAATAWARKSDVPPTPTSPPMIVANAGTWIWSDPNAWIGGVVPGDGAVVQIPSNALVTLRGDSARIKWIEVVGTGRLALSFSLSSHLYVETLFVDGNASFTLSSLPQGLTAQVTFTTDGNPVTDAKRMARGLIAEGKVTMLGPAKTPFLKVTADVPKGTNTLTLESAPSNWQPQDEVVLTGTYFRRNAPLQDERRHITNVSGNIVTVDTPFTYDHLHVSPSMHLHLANLTRSVTFRSERTDGNINGDTTYNRGHVILEHRDTDIEQVAFVNLGRTDKSRPLNDAHYNPTTVAMELPTGVVDNPRGRYAVHVHETEKSLFYPPWTTPPSTPPTKIIGCVVDGTPGWGFVNHSSDVDFDGDVAVNFTGAGFVTEGGDELGIFNNDIAIHGSGDGTYRMVRLNFGNQQRPQPLADFAFSGHGFWFSGPALTVTNVVANSCNGDGVIWHPTGTVDLTNTADAFVTNPRPFPNGRYHYFPEGWISTVYQGYPGYSTTTFKPRHWKDPQNNTNPPVSSFVMTADLPILKCENVDSYANLIGFRPRFSNESSVDFYDEVPLGQPAGQTKTFGYQNEILPASGETDITKMSSRLTQSIGKATDSTAGLRLWNNEEAIGLRYVDKTSWYWVNAVNRLDYDEANPAANPGTFPTYGIEMFFHVFNQTFNNLTIDGYELPVWRVNGANAGNVTFTSPTYTRNAGDDWRTNTPAPPANPRVTSQSGTSVTLAWDAVPNVKRYLVRYRPTNSTLQQQWQYATPGTATSTTLSGLLHTTYYFQIIAGTQDPVTLKPNDITTWTANTNTFTIP